MTYTFKINDERIKPRPDLKLYTGNVNSYIFEFEFSNLWDNLIKFASFITDNITYIVLIENNMVSVPHEILKNPGICQLGLYATNGEDDLKRISTNLIDLEIFKGAYADGEIPNTPTPDVWETIFKNSIPKIIDRYWYLYNPNTDEYLNTGILAEAITPQKGVDYLTPDDIEALGIDKKQDKSDFVKTSDIREEIDWYNSPYLTDDKYPSAAFVPKIMNYFFQRYYPSVQIDMIMEDKENILNKTNLVTSDASEEKYTSEKAVYDLLTRVEMLMFTMITEGGSRKDYSYAFAYLDKLKPSDKFSIVPTTGINNMFYYYTGDELPPNIDCSKLSFDWNTAKYTDPTQPLKMFQGANQFTHLYDIGLPAMKYYQSTFNGASRLQKIDILRCQEESVFNYTFTGCTKLVDIYIEGSVGNDINFSDGRSLNDQSIKNIINVLSDNVTDKTASFSLIAINKLYTEEEWLSLIAAKPNWTIAVK